jgi:hypothetical protein
MLKRDKKNSLEDYGFGKGYTMSAERIARFLGSLDRLIEQGLNVCLIAHAKVTRFEPPDGLMAYDRYELKMTRQTSPLVKEWADSLLFANFKTLVVENESGKAKGIGGKERVILTQRAASHDAKCRVPNVAEEIPMTWAAVKSVFGEAPVKAAEPTPEPERTVETQKDPYGIIEWNCEGLPLVEFMVARGAIKEGQSWRDASPEYLQRAVNGIEKFVKAIEAWKAGK